MDGADVDSDRRPWSAAEVSGEGFLLVCFDGTFAVPAADPADCFAWCLAAEDGKTGKRRTGATVTAVTAHLAALARTSSVEQRLKGYDNQNSRSCGTP